jgi:phthalate 4,5-dioxygenase oxygenase subunit
MLSKEENDLLTQVGPGTPMGTLMRNYWIPAALASDLVADGAPVRVKILGEKLVAFRDTDGKVGLLDEYCPHRGVSLFLGRNEECGLRCVYHGWKFDVGGNCLDMPTEAEDSPKRRIIKVPSYRTIEMGGVVWAYLGADEPPAPPKFEWTQLRDDQRVVTHTWQECNWLQALEGGIDSMHASTLHTLISDKTRKAGLSGLWRKPMPLRDEVELTSWGHAYTSMRPVDEARTWVKVYQYVMPFHTFFPFELGGDGEIFRPWINGHMFVPIDDENTMVYNMLGKYGDAPMTHQEAEVLEWSRGRGEGEIGPNFRKVRNRDVDWMIDRSAQRSETYSGIEGINTQDHAVQESMGPIVDRTKEHLGTTDVAVVQTRRLLLRNLKAENKDELPGRAPTYYLVRAIERIMEEPKAWRTELRPLFDRSTAKAD